MKSPVSENTTVLSSFVLGVEAILGVLTNYMRYLAFLQLILPDYLDYREETYFLSSKELGQEMWTLMVSGNLHLQIYQQQHPPKWNSEPKRSREESFQMPGHLL